MFNKNNKNYTLKDIQRIFTYTPTVFILFLAFLAIIISYSIVDFKKTRKLDLIQQKQILNNEFEKKDILYKFADTIKKQVDEEFSDVKLTIRKIVYKVLGNFEKNNIDTKNLDTYLNTIEKKHNIDIVIFTKNKLTILHGSNTIMKLQNLLFHHKDNEKFKKLILQYISSQGKNNLQYWRYDLQKSLILSFFDIHNVDGKEFFIGAFSKINNIKNITKKIIKENITNNKQSSDYSFWFFDSNTKNVFNYYNSNKNIFYSTSYIREDSIDHYLLNDYENKEFNKKVFYYNKFSYLISIKYNTITNTITSKMQHILDDYNILYIKILLFIIFLTVILIIFSLIFSKFIKNIFNNYNLELSNQTKSLEHWKKRFELAVIASNDGLWDIDFRNDSIYFSKQWLEMLGYEEDELKNFNDWFNLVHIDDKNEVSKKFDNILLEKEDNFICEYRLKTKNNGYKWIFARGKIFVDESEKSKRMLMMSMDIDKNKKMSKELLDVELLVEDGRMVIFKCNNDKNLSIKYISNSIKNYGYTKENFENNIINLKCIVLEEDKVILENAIQTAILNNQKSFSTIIKIQNNDKDIRWIFLRAILLKDDFENVTQFYGYMYDITKIKVSEEELKLKVEVEVEENIKKDRLLVQQSKLASMGEMLGNIAHQWRQPLNTVNLIIHFIRDNYDNDDFTKEQLEKYINKSKTQIDYMSQTIDDFRNFYKPSKAVNKFNISNTINDVIKILRIQLEENEITLIKNIEDIYITNYENELKQSILNIINNAKDAIIKKKKEITYEGEIQIIMEKQNNFVQIQIKNNADHIKNDIIDKIFEPYFTTKFETQGTGIGLYMCKTIIETNMKGKIYVKNTTYGVEFLITLPI